VHDSAELAAVAAVTGALLVGSSGLARRVALATLSPPDAARGRLRPHGEAARSTPDTVANVLVVAGSPAAATRRQLERLPRSVTLLATPASEPRASYALAASTETDPRDREAAAPAHATHDRDSGQAAAALAQRIAIADRPDLLVLTGGQTARLVCTRLQATGVDVRGEVQPGIPFGRLQGGPWQGVLVVTKAGGFGGPDALLDVLRLLGPSCLDTP
jgi:D-threonate/D-erythronate kinase